MKRTAASLLALVMTIALALTGCAKTPPGGAGGPSTATVGLTYIPDIQFAPFYTAKERGLFTERGVDVTLRHHGSNEGLFTALVAGQEQYVIAGGDEMMQARAEGMDLVAIGQYYRRYPVAVIVPEASDVRSVADLKGRRVGVPGRYGESWFGLQAALQDAGLTESDIEVVEIGYTAQAALTGGRVDAVVGFSNNDQVQFGLAGIPTRTVPLTAAGEPPLVSIVLVTTAANLKQNPATAKKVASGMVAGIDTVAKGPANAVADAKAHIPTLGQPGAEASALATLKATIPLWTTQDGLVSGTMDEAAWKAMADFMQAKGLISKPVDPAQAMTNDLFKQ